jgi:hypothetical protein
MNRSALFLVIGTLALAAAACSDRDAGERADTGSPGSEQEARSLEKAAETGAAARAAAGVEEDAEAAAQEVERKGVAATAKKVGETLEGNVERSAEAYEDTYREERAAGEDAVEASGEAYDAVLDEAKK